MNELQAIVAAYAEASARGERTALATIVGVEGSAYRRPGARMLIAGNGRTTGALSGGCLERDVAERAARVLKTRGPEVVEYDTRGSEDIVWGLGLGCSGVVRILLESLHAGSHGERALRFISDCLQARGSGVLATVIAGNVKAEGCEYRPFAVGERLLLDASMNICGPPLADGLPAARIREDALEILAGKRAASRSYEAGRGHIEIFFDVITPPRPLVIFGAEHDAVPLVHLARMLGWHVTVVDARARGATRERFAEADEVVLCGVEEVAARVSLTEDTAAVVMTHNYPIDVELLRVLLPSPVRYLGVLGPKQRTSKLLEEISGGASAPADSQHARLHSPTGIDLGAETPEEIALSIISEIKAVCAARGGGFLRDRNAPIHVERLPDPATVKVSIEPFASRPSEGATLAACRSS
ncbi:MAG: xanthine dehydrogenase accessory factor [Acidobacteriota bacterium]|jgi:xanthine/CO dehydrogenase XdhC/CoxF family maturation factor|nr:xanthine dehydrogenase accessory factor [Acidobacteriota bacterium]